MFLCLSGGLPTRRGQARLRGQARRAPRHHLIAALSDDLDRDFLRGGHVVEGFCWNGPDRTRNWDPRFSSAAHRGAAVSCRRQRNLRTSSLLVFNWLDRSTISSSMLPPDKQSGNEDRVRVREDIAVFGVERPIGTEMHGPIQYRADADRRTRFNSAIRIDNRADPCVGRSHHIPPVFNGAYDAHA